MEKKKYRTRVVRGAFNGGKIFIFNKDDEKSHREVVEYGVSKGIPESQMDFLEVKF